MRRMTALVILAVFVAAVSIVSAIYFGSKVVHNNGHVDTIGVGVYWDEACTSICDNIDWGEGHPGDTLTRLLYVRNEGSELCNLTLVAHDWTPAGADTYLIFSTSYANETIAPQGILPLTWQLHVEETTIALTNFEFWITVTGYSE